MSDQGNAEYNRSSLLQQPQEEASSFPRIPSQAFRTVSRQTGARALQSEDPNAAFSRITNSEDAVDQQDNGSELRQLVSRDPFDPALQPEIDRLAQEVESRIAATIPTGITTNAADLAHTLPDIEDARFEVLEGIISKQPFSDYDERFYELQDSSSRGLQSVFRLDKLQELLSKGRKSAEQTQRLLREQQTRMLQEEMITTTYMTIQLEQEILSRRAEYMQLSPRQIWQQLTKVAFNNLDYNQIGKKYSIYQITSFRLSILHFIQDIQRTKRLQQQVEQEAPNDMTRQTELVMGRPRGFFAGQVDMHVNSAGFVITLGQVDYDKVNQLTGGENIQSIGFFPQGPIAHQSPLAWGSVMFVLRTDDQESMQTTEEHETRHAIFERYFAARYPVSYPETEEEARRKEEENATQTHIVADSSLPDAAHPQKKEPEPRDVEGTEETLKEYARTMLEHALDETVAYRTQEVLPGDILPHQIAADSFTNFMIQIRDEFAVAPNLTSEEKQQAWSLFMKQYAWYMRQLRQGRIVMHELFTHGRVPPSPDGRTLANFDPQNNGRELFFSTLLRLHAGSPLRKLQRYSLNFLGQSLGTVLYEAQTQADARGYEYSEILSSLSGLTRDGMLDYLDKYREEHDDKSLLKPLLSNAEFTSPTLLPGALTMLDRNIDPQLTGALLTRVNSILFFNQDTLPIEMLDRIQSSATELRAKITVESNTSDDEVISRLDDLSTTLKTVRGIREARFV